ncbi:cysteine hydrolase family protein [Streptomyces cavernicola]|uniref:Cysteine hydrolase n=1 Tax=Streptomyces cavernicola TaxID=3043613 RepID=A0ABT6S7J2_9ACTN|nr:cysteine hydrolase [Streptomyces sp. B-S-A6]MDI3403286.1 cysteine hydrolase [Streptomyces sp. B-S-A6]
MHTTVIDPAIRARYRALKGGQEYAFTTVDPCSTAHLVVDMQNGFMEEGMPLEVPVARSIVPHINAVSRAVRSHGGTNVYFRFTTRSSRDWSVYFEQFQAAEFGDGEVTTFQPGSHGHALHRGLDVTAEDTVMDKTRFSPFTPSSSDALQVLRERGIDTVLVSGTLTDCCSAATARDAQQLGFRVILISDANAALSDAEHNAAVNNVAAYFGDIRTTEQVVALVEEAPERAAPTAVTV